MDFDKLPVVDMSPATARPNQLTPETPVDVINRGFEVLTRKFDGYDYDLIPHTQGLMRMPYGAALHFQKHCTVPGTRDALTSAEMSFIGIVRNATTGAPVDEPDYCEPFTEEQCRQFGQRIEAIARDVDEAMTVVPVSKVTQSGRVPVGRQSAGRRRPLQREGHGNVADALAPPEGQNDAQAEIAAAEADQGDE